ncbi:glycoside hydrolase family 65 protein [Pelodictyon luteolum]|uniref:Glycosyl hydrolase, family 65 n=1 Tax=Chlorobium luteolum (strain DSM 273 / BCRC 81028 / 2530) TaxID=319225 RepID=Q3B3F5_CHLL3|nr:glycosyl hydrolase family 65 protein [Pelodictyon luteolum]ABB24126.1 glycosyl hydrolase, family 65 [Pelodictyon luteolum DSM 273]
MGADARVPWADSLLELSKEEWLLRKSGFRRSEKHIRINETLLTLGNGYLNIRGSLEELPSGHAGGMYISGVYDKSEADVEELVKCPMWTDLSLWVEGQKFCLSTSRAIQHEQILDLKKGALHRRTTYRHPTGKILTLETLRIVMLHNQHYGCMLVRITPRNFSGPLRVFSGLNGGVCNRGYFPEELLKHLQLEKIERGRNFMYLEMKTREQEMRIAEAASWRLVAPPGQHLKWEPRIYGEKFTSEITLDVQRGKPYLFEKLSVVTTAREVPPEAMMKDAICRLRAFVRKGVQTEIRSHVSLWDERWKQADVQIQGDDAAQKALRYNIYQLLINGPPAPGGVGAKFLSSEGYLGHVFWDTEIFILPFFIYNFPDIARNMLLYRFNTLPGARENARRLGYAGAKYAWESATTGVDVTPRFASKLERTIRFIYTGAEEDHIVSDVIYGVEKYFRVTGDEAFLVDCGLEMIFLTARFWASRVIDSGERCEIRCVIGPDEFHEHVDNNAYTNALVKWHLKLAAMLFKHVGKSRPEVLEALSERLSLTRAEAAAWLRMSRKLGFRRDQKTGVIEQFDGYFALKDHVIDRFDREGHPVLPRGVTYRNIASTRLIKQGDVLMMIMLFPHAFTRKEIEVNYDFYEKRTAHKSSLSHCVHAIMGIQAGRRQHAYSYFMKTALFDLENLHKNTDLGIHAAAVGGTWQTVISGFGGFSIKSDRLVLKPWLPKKWESLSFSVRWRDRTVDVKVLHDRVSVLVHSLEDIELPLTLYRKTSRIRTNVLTELPYTAS